MGHEFGASAFHISTGTTVRQVVASSSSRAVPLTRNGQKPKYCLVQAFKSNVVGEPVLYARQGDWLTVGMAQSGSGSSVTDFALVVGSNPVLVYTLGYAQFNLGRAANFTPLAASITFTATALENW